MKIEQGQIWRVSTEEFLTSGKDGAKTLSRQLKINKGEYLEIRYPFAWHFRTIDSHYLHAEESTIIDNCELIGSIWPKVKSKNKASLKEIIELELFDRV